MAKIILRAGKVAIKIIGLFAILGFIFYSINLLTPARAQEDPIIQAQIAELMQIAEDYRANEQYDEAVQVYNDIIAGYPYSEQAMYAMREIIVCRIEQKDFAEAQACLEQFWAQYSTDERFVEYVKHVKDLYWDAGEYTAHFDLCARIVEEFPEHPLSLDILVDEVAGYIHVKNMPEASEKMEQLWAQYSTDERFVENVVFIKDLYWNAGEYTAHFNLCERIIEEFGEHPLSPEVLRDEIAGYIHFKDMPEAAEKVEQLWAQYSTDERFVEHAKYVADRYWQVGEYAACLDLCDRLIAEFAGNENVIQLLRTAAGCYVKLGEQEQADAVIEELKLGFTDHSEFGTVINGIADNYRELLEYEKALGLYEYVAVNCSDAEAVVSAEVGIGVSQIHLSEDVQVEAVVDALVEDFNDLPRVDWGVFVIGEEYYFLAEKMKKQGLTKISNENYRQAIGVWRRIIDDLPETEHTTYSWYFSGVCYIRLKEYEKTVAHFEKVIEKWPGYHRAARAQFSIGKCYESLKDAGTLPGSEADLKIEQAYKTVLENYLDSASAIDACFKLGWLNFRKGLWPESVHYWELSREKLGVSPKDYKALNILYPLGRAYEELGRFDLAVKAYSEFINVAPSIDPRVDKVKSRLEQLALDKG